VETQPELVAQHYTAAGCAEQAVPYWYRAGQHASERSAHLEAISHLTTGIALLQTLPETAERIEQELRLQTTLGPALMAAKGFGAPEVERAYARARDLCTQVGETPQLFAVMWGLWYFYLARAAWYTAHELGEQLLSLAQRVHDPTLLLLAHRGLGQTLAFLGAFAPAQTHLEQAMALYNPAQHRSLAFRYGQDQDVICRSWTAVTLWLLGYPDQALRRAHEALTLAQELAHPFSVVYALTWTAMVHLSRREVPGVHERAEAEMALAREHGFVVWVAFGTVLWGWTLAAEGQHEAGTTQMRQGIAACRGVGNEVFHPYYLALLADIAREAGQVEEGLRVLAEALTVVDTSGERFYEAEIYRLKGEFLLKQDVPDEQEAESCLRQAVDIARRQQAKSLELRAARSLSGLWQQQGKQAEARELLAPIYGWFTEGFDTADLQEAKALLAELA
jgi:predicted ATPase